MAEFNPITDLMPLDSPMESDNTSTEQIQSLKTRLEQTQSGVTNVLNILKAKNTLLGRDLDKITALNYRLRRTIPRIPILPGKAGVEFGELAKERKKRGGFSLPRLPLFFPDFPSKKQKTKTTFKKKKVRNAIKTLSKVKDAALITGATVGTVKSGQSLIKEGRKITKKFMKDGGKVRLGLPAKEESAITRGFRNIKKFFGGTNKSVKVDKPAVNYSDLPTKERMRNAVIMNEKGIIKFPPMSREGILIRRNAKLKKELLDLEKKIPEFAIFDFMKKAKLKSPTLLKSDLKKLYIRDYQRIMRSYRQNKIGVQDMLEQTDDLRNAYETNALQVDRYGEEVMAIFETFKMRGVNTKKVNQSILKDVLEDIRKIPKRFPKILGKSIDLSKINVKPMSNDIAMLNTDTGVTNTVIILTDPPIA